MDEENRKKIPRDLELPNIEVFSKNTHGNEVKQDVQKYFDNRLKSADAHYLNQNKRLKQRLINSWSQS